MTDYMTCPPVFIVGMPRSGTTLLRMMLNAHPLVCLSPETHFFREVCSSKDVYSSEVDHEQVKNSWSHYFNSRFGSRFGFDIETVSRIGEESLDYGSLFANILKSYAIHNKKTIWGEKTPSHLFNVAELLHWFPDARIVHLIRDPRAVCLSLKKVEWGSEDVFFTSTAWNRFTRAGDGLLNRYPDSILEVSYEDLVMESDKILTKFCEFIGIDYRSSMLDFHKVSEIYIEENQPWKDGVNSPVNTSGLSKWKTELTASEIRVICIRCRDLMVKKGYVSSAETGALDYLRYLLRLSTVNVIAAFRSAIHRIVSK